MAGGPILCKSQLQLTVALSSTEADFVAANDTGKSILCTHSILDELGIKLDEATEMFIDNAGACLMGNSHKPTKCTKHLAIKYFALLEWTDRDLIVLKSISTHDNNSDILTKATIQPSQGSANGTQTTKIFHAFQLILCFKHGYLI